MSPRNRSAPDKSTSPLSANRPSLISSSNSEQQHKYIGHEIRSKDFIVASPARATEGALCLPHGAAPHPATVAMTAAVPRKLLCIVIFSGRGDKLYDADERA
jgi:hypothetical protein